ncbi:MAG TPA: ATP-binding cassette domain-containing protein [Spirochaetales bacterium]|nr:ATP-binding cassette domain-containing protein [Spirochaetales bacterium]HRY54586.1 ATP-binding cassette domain-containing protein [Spirochaetia bacterium]HRZ65603.1 ATP-binding cassette domain-containing protein [Spirochaetia bacterium]
MASGTAPLIALEGASVRYGSLDALDGLDFEVRPGEIHAIVGEHGAGKSSLARVLAGAVRPEPGRVLWEGAPVSPYDRDIARGLGVEFVAQENGLFLNQTVAFNLLVNRRSFFAGIGFRPRRLVDEAARYLGDCGAGVDAAAPAQSLALPDRVLVELLRALYSGPRLLILDEALEKLSARGLELARPRLRAIAAAGGSVLVITHRIDDIYDFADRITILRAGEILMTDRSRNVDKVSLIKLAYTQIMNRPRALDGNSEFYHFLKYNEAILEHLPVSLVVVDREGEIKLRNRRAQEFFSLGEPGEAGRGLEALFPAGNEEALAAAEAVVAGRAYECVYGMRLVLGGEARTIDLTFDPIMDGDRFIGGMLIFNDITEQAALRERMILSEKLAAVGLLSAGVAHEINNPLETICNSVDFLKMKVEGGRQAAALARIEEEVSSIGHIVSNLMAFSGKRQERAERLDLGELLGETLSLLRHNESFAGREIRFDPPLAPLLVRASRTEVRQVFINLLKNGIEAMPGGGALSLRLSREAAEHGAWAVGAVEDQGPGLGAEAQARAFLPFFSTKSGSEGHMGLGLSIAYGIAAKLGGSIEAGRAEGGGARFVVRLPAAE